MKRIDEITCVAVDDAKRVRVPVAEELSPDDVRIEPHYLQILGVVPLVEYRSSTLMIVHPRWRVADYVHLAITEQNRNEHRISIFRIYPARAWALGQSGVRCFAVIYSTLISIHESPRITGVPCVV